MREIRLIIVDDHPIARKGLLAIVAGEPAIRVIGEAQNAREAINLALALKPDIAILDIEMKKDPQDGFAIARALRAQGFAGAIIFLTYLDKKYSLGTFLQSGEKGYIIKDDSPREIIRGIKEVASGREFISYEMLRKLPPYYNSDGVHVGTVHLTLREIEVMDLLLEHLTSKEIGQRLGINYRTVEKHEQHLHEKLGLNSKHALIVWWRANRPH
jgi:two-component system nitrate/nitrite response regulator NarL